MLTNSDGRIQELGRNENTLDYLFTKLDEDEEKLKSFQKQVHFFKNKFSEQRNRSFQNDGSLSGYPERVAVH